MQGLVEALVPICYVRDLARSRAFYELFGLVEQRSGGDGPAQWSYVQYGRHTMLLVSVQPPLITVELPLLIYLYVDDLVAVRERLTDAGHAVEQVGYPEHAPGGEARVTDPDGNVVLVGQRTMIPIEDRAGPTGPEARFSLVRQAAEAVERRGGAPARCQVGGTGGVSCDRPAEVKLADSWGDSLWGCIQHAEEALITAHGAFVASEDGQGLGQFLRSRQTQRQVPANTE